MLLHRRNIVDFTDDGDVARILHGRRGDKSISRDRKIFRNSEWDAGSY